MNFLNLVFSILILIQLSFGLKEREVLWEIEALWDSRQIEYDEYLWLKEWSKDQVAHCEELAQYLTLECQESSSIQRQRFNWRYSQGDHRYEYSGQSQSMAWRQSLLSRKDTFHHTREELRINRDYSYN